MEALAYSAVVVSAIFINQLSLCSYIVKNKIMNDDFYIDLNFSNFDFPNVWEVLPPHEIAIKIGIIAPLTLFGLLGNGLLLATILGNRSLRSPSNYLIANMALSDFCVLLLSPGLFLFHEIFQSYKLGEIGCRVEATIEIAFLITSVITLCFVSYERLTAIAFPMQARLTFKQTRYVIAASWILGVILSSPLAIFRSYTERQWRNFLEAFCTENLEILPLYWHILIVALVWIPLGVLVFCYTTIFFKLDQYEKMRKKRDHPLTISYKRKFAKTLFVVVVTFIILRIPFTSIVFMRSNMLQHNEMNQVEGSFQTMWYISRYLIFLNCALTPCVYGITNENFRRAFRKSKWYKYVCFCPLSVSSNSMSVYTINNPEQTKALRELKPRNPIVTNILSNSKSWMKMAKFSTTKLNVTPKSQDKFTSVNTFL